MKPNPSQPISPPATAATKSTSVGAVTLARPGQIGSALPAREDLARMAPDEIDRNLPAWLKPPLGQSIVSKSYQGHDPQWIGAILGYKIDGDHDPEDLRQALAVLEQVSAPASPAFCAEQIGKLRVVMKISAQQAEDIKMLIVAFAEELAAYPPDVVRYACQTWKANNVFFPAWSELREICEAAVMMRRDLKCEVERKLQLAPFSI